MAGGQRLGPFSKGSLLLLRQPLTGERLAARLALLQLHTGRLAPSYNVRGGIPRKRFPLRLPSHNCSEGFGSPREN